MFFYIIKPQQFSMNLALRSADLVNKRGLLRTEHPTDIADNSLKDQSEFLPYEPAYLDHLHHSQKSPFYTFKENNLSVSFQERCLHGGVSGKNNSEKREKKTYKISQDAFLSFSSLQPR